MALAHFVTKLIPIGEAGYDGQSGVPLRLVYFFGVGKVPLEKLTLGENGFRIRCRKV